MVLEISLAKTGIGCYMAKCRLQNFVRIAHFAITRAKVLNSWRMALYLLTSFRAMFWGLALFSEDGVGCYTTRQKPVIFRIQPENRVIYLSNSIKLTTMLFNCPRLPSTDNCLLVSCFVAWRHLSVTDHFSGAIEAGATWNASIMLGHSHTLQRHLTPVI